MANLTRWTATYSLSVLSMPTLIMLGVSLKRDVTGLVPPLSQTLSVSEARSCLSLYWVRVKWPQVSAHVLVSDASPAWGFLLARRCLQGLL